MQVWTLRESFLAYERFHGVYASKEEAQAKAPAYTWSSIAEQRKLPVYMEDDNDPFHSPKGSESTYTEKDGLRYLWIVEPHDIP